MIGPEDEIGIETSRQKNLSDYSCYENGHKRNEYWALRWEDQFKKETFDDWAMVVENKYCSGHGVDHVSCDVSSNIAIRSGALVLNAAQQKYYAHDYTGAQVSTTFSMVFDRIDIRAAQPLGSHLHTSMFAYNDQSAEMRRLKQYAHNFFVIDLSDYKQDVGWIEIASHTQRPSIMHGIHQQKFADKANADHVYREVEMDDLNEFHTYSLRWNDSLAQFSFDQNLTEPFSNHLNRINTPFQIVLMIGVGGDHFKEPTNSKHLNWICPALIVDYIRVFDKVNQTGDLPKCQFREPLSNDVIEDICQFALSKSESLTDTSKTEKSITRDISRPSKVALISSIVLTSMLLIFIVIFVLIKLGVLENPISKLRAMYSKDESIIGYDRQADAHSQSQTEVNEFNARDF